MGINGVSDQVGAYTGYSPAKSASSKSSSQSKSSEGTTKESTAAVYEASDSKNSSSKTTTTSSSKTSNSAIVAQLKNDQKNRMSQMQSLVENMFSKQGISIGKADDMWRTLASGNFTADADSIAQAKKDIADDGYWGVSQTSDRIFSFAMALSNGDEDKMKEMKAAVEKGFKLATKSWGKSLPDISNNTYDTVMKKFDDWFDSDKTEPATTERIPKIV